MRFHLYAWLLILGAGSLVGCADSAPETLHSETLRSETLAAVDTFTPLLPNDPYFADQWQLHNTGPRSTIDGRGTIAGADHAHVANAWGLIVALGLATNIEDIGKDVRLAILDDGFDLKHEEFAGRIVASRNFGDAVEADNLFSNVSGKYNYHGMLVAGIAGASGGNGKGLSGACPGCKLVLGRITGAGNTAATYSDYFAWALEQDAHVINNSWGPDPAVAKADLDAVVARMKKEGRGGLGSVLVFASGNSNEDFAWNAFAMSDDTISVAASSSKAVRHSFSNFGSGMDLVAPTSGAEKSGSVYVDRIWTTDNYLEPPCLSPGQTPSNSCSDTAGWTPTRPTAGGDGWIGKYSYRFSHTSAAAPVVSGVVGLLLHVNPKLTSDQVRDILRATADKVSQGEASYDQKGFSTKYGYGRVNALRAVAFAHIAGGGEISDGMRDAIDEASPCTRDNCWDPVGGAPVPPPDQPDAGSPGGGSTGSQTSGGSSDPTMPEDDAGMDNGGGNSDGSGSANGGATAGTGGAGSSTGGKGSASNGNNGQADDGAGSSGCSLSARAPSSALSWLGMFGVSALWIRRRQRGKA